MGDTTDYKPPRTRREWLVRERTRLYKALESATRGYDDLIAGRIQSYSLGTRSITRYTPDLKTLADWITGTQNHIAEIEAILNGRPIRETSQYVFKDPSLIGRRW